MSTLLPLGPALVLATLLWAAGRVAVALIEGHLLDRRARSVDELLHHVDAVRVAVCDVRDAVDRLAGPHGGAR